MTTNLHPEDAKAALRAMEGHPFDQAGEGFAVVILMG
jgi:hypothetical protein